MNESIEVFTDGGCQGNPGPGAWAFVIVGGSDEREAWGYDPATTNNRMELLAVIKALESLATAGRPVRVHTDSQYVKNGITSWISKWKTNGWKTADRKDVKNRDLWERLDAATSRVDAEFRWIAGHSGHRHNERCDALVRAATASGESSPA